MSHPLETALKMLMGFGPTGKLVWDNGKAIKDERTRFLYLRDAVNHLRLKKEDGPDYWVRLPADFQTFMESPELMNKRGALWPVVMQEAKKMNSGKYTEAVLTGAIGVAKTTIAVYTQLYQQYLLSCMVSPHKTFGLDSASEITTIFQSINKTLAKDVDYQRMRNALNGSPYFEEFFPYRKDLESEIRFPNNVIVKPIAGNDSGAIGQNVIGGIMDEVNFMAKVEDSKKTHGSEAYDQAMQNYNTIARRRESRFQVKGYLPGMLCLVSSRNFPGQFTDIKEAEAKTNPRIFIYDKKLWDVQPEKFSFHDGKPSKTLIDQYGPDCPLWFDVFIGDASRKPRVLTPEEVKQYPAEDKPLIQKVPQENRNAFDNDLLRALRDVLGVATQAMHPFMLNQDAVANSFGKVQSIASRVDCNFKTTKISILRNRFRMPDEMHFAHVDLSFAKDSCGVAIGHVEKFVPIQRGPETEIMPVIDFDLTLEIQPPPGDEIIFENIRRLFYKVRELGMNLRWVTFDQFQSKDSLQILAAHKFVCGQTSMDKDTTPYDVLKQAFYDGRVKCPHHPRALTELIRLELDTKKQKIDHPPNGSKDIADAMAGVAYGLTMRRELWHRHGVPLTQVPAYLTVKKSNLDERQAELVERRQSGAQRVDVRAAADVGTAPW